MPPRRLNVVNEKLKSGYLLESLTELRRVYDPKVPSDRVLMAELSIETEGQEDIRTLIGQLVDLPALEQSVKARACVALGEMLCRENRLPEAMRLFERAVHFAANGEDASVLCRAQLRLLVAKFDLFGPASLGTLPGDVWHTAMRTGDPVLLAMSHARFAALEGRRGAFDLARRHLDLGMHCLARTENPYIEGLICNVYSTLSAVAADPVAALGYAERTLQLSIRSGARHTRIAALNNLCHVSILLGRIAAAERYLKVAEDLVRNEPFYKMCLCESRAQIQLLSGHLDDCEMTLSALTSFQHNSGVSQRSYAALEAATTQARLLRLQGRFDSALEIARSGAVESHTRSLPLLEALFHIHCTDALVDLGRFAEATRTIGLATKVITLLGSDALTVRAELERVRGRVLASLGDRGNACGRFNLSISMHEAMGQSIARDEAARCRDMVMNLQSDASAYAANIAASVGSVDRTKTADDVDAIGRTGEVDAGQEGTRTSPEASRLGDVEVAASLFTVASRPDLLGTVAYDLVVASDVAVRVALVLRRATSVDVVRQMNWPVVVTDSRSEGLTSIDLGVHQDKAYQLLVEGVADISSASRLAAFETIVRAAVAKEAARRERLERTSVWPPDRDSHGEGPLLGSQRMREVYREVRKVAGSELTVLLTGETGVGKEILAREIHRLSPRAGHDFRPIVCAGIASGMLDSQLFGYRRGSFTGAVADFPGVIRGAKGGTLFLDEIGELTSDLQIKLLRFLDSKEVHSLGDLAPAEVDVRIIAATNANLSKLIEDGRFREDLLHRLSIATFNIPPLRERREEIPSLIEYFLTKYAQQNGNPAPRVSDEALEHLLLYRWPGNVRQLRNEMERLAGIMEPGSTIRAADLKPEIRAGGRTETTIPGPGEIIVRLDQQLPQAMDAVEREIIKRVLNGYKGNLADAAQALGISRKGLYHKRQRLGML